MVKDISCKQKQQESWGTNTHIRKNKTKSKSKDKERHYIMIKGSIQEEDSILVNIYASNTGAHKYIKQTLIDIKGENYNVIIAGALTPHLHQWTDHPNRKSIRQQWS